MILAFDTETDGLPIPSLDPLHPRQVHLVELGLVLMEDTGLERACASLVVQANGWNIPEGARRVHGIDDDVAKRCGVDVRFALITFAFFLDRASTLIAYNLRFDRDVMSIELIRQGETRPVAWPDVSQICVCDAVTPAMNLPPTAKMLRVGRTGPKRPKLSEAYEGLFGEPLIGAHGALADARACARIYLRLKAVGHL